MSGEDNEGKGNPEAPPRPPETPPTADAASAEPSADDWKDRYLRALAELDNYRKRMERDREQNRQYAVDALVRDLLPVLDSLELAANAVGGAEAIRSGVTLALQEALRILADRGVAPIEAVGQMFDARFHEAAGVLPDDARPHGTVLSELRRGYKLRDRVLRPARVQIAVAPPEAKETD